MRKLFSFFVAFLLSATSFAAVSYELNGGVTNDDNWLSKGDMWTAFCADAGITTLGTLEEVKALGDPYAAICTPLATANARAILDNAKWDWLEAYIMTVQNADAGATALVEGASGAGWRYAFAAFFLESQRTSWPQSANFSHAGTVEAFQKAWKHGFANPTEPTAEFVLNAPYLEGKTFDGWYATADFSGKKITTVNAETTGTLYAKWVEYIPTVVEVRALADDTETKVSGVVNFISGKYIYIQDVTAGIVVYTTETPTCKVGDKITVKGKKVIYGGAPEITSAVIESAETASVAAPTVFETLTPLLADSLEHKYFATRVTVPVVTIVEYDNYNNPTVEDALGNQAVCYKMVLDPIIYPIGTRVTITAVAGWYNGFQFVGDAKNIVIPVAGVKENYTYPVRDGKYTLENNWVISNIEDNFAANKPGSNDYVRGMAAKDGIMYFINRETKSLVRVDGETGKMLEPLKLQGTDTLFKSATVDSVGNKVWADKTTLPFNDIKFDQAGNCLIGACMTGATTCQTFFIYVVDLETGVCTKLIEDYLWDNPGLNEVIFRFDAFGVAGDVTKNGVVMAADANGSWNVYRWLITDGVAGEGEKVACILDPTVDQSLFINAFGFGSYPQIFPQNEDGSLFYVDGFNTLPMLFYGKPKNRAFLIDDFIHVPTGVEVTNQEGDVCKMNQGHNGLVEFQVGEEYFLLMAATNVVGSPTSAFALYKFADADREFAGMEPLWYFPSNGLGSTSNGCRVAVPSVDVVSDTEATLYIYTSNNGYASYTFTTINGSLPPANITVTSNNTTMGTVSGSGAYNIGDSAVISAVPKGGYHFSHWDDGNTQNPRVVKVTKDKTYTAYFEKNTYNITKQYDAQQGSISGSTSGKYFDVISLTAIPNTGYHFNQWHDGVTDNPRSFVLTQDTTFAAFFAVNHYLLNTSINNPDAGTVSGAGTYDYNTYAEISATANYGYHFSYWNDGNTDNPRVVQVTGNKTYTAYFDNNTYSITKQCDAQQGSITGPTSGKYLDVITLTATPKYGYHFTQWSDGVTTNPRSFVLTKDTTFAAFFTVNQYQLSTSSNNSEAGTVSGAGTYDYNTYAEISATANYGYHFTQWNDGNTDNPRVVQVTEDKTYTAYFDKNTYSITTQYDAEQGSITGPTSGKYLDVITLTATPKYGYHFTQWSDGVTTNPRSFVLTKDTTFAAFFTVNQYQLSTSSNNPKAGTVSGAGTYDYNTYAEISATANYGYHFSYWNDGNTDNPRVVQVTGDKTYTAYFNKNTYTLSVDYNSAYGTVTGPTSGEYMDELTLTATPNLGYVFVGWSDGVKDNPRTIVLNKDIRLTANFAQAYSGQCGDNLYWAYDEDSKKISITGSGDMYNYTKSTQPWLLFQEQITEVTTSNTTTSIGTSAFEGCIRLGKVSLGYGMGNIAAKAFAECKRLYDIYVYASYPPFAEESSFANYNVYLYVPCENQRDYVLDVVWGEFKFIECIGAESDETGGDDVTVTPGTNDVTITWPTEDEAETYSIVITKDSEVFCTLTFNNNGQLVSIAFAPGREGNHPAQYAEATANGYRFTVTGLKEGTKYGYNLEVKDSANQTIQSYEGEFTTMSDVTTDMDNVTSTTNCQKIFRDGQLLIIRDGKTYNAQGAAL